jgi:hypothetical protein
MLEDNNWVGNKLGLTESVVWVGDKLPNSAVVSYLDSAVVPYLDSVKSGLLPPYKYRPEQQQIVHWIIPHTGYLFLLPNNQHTLLGK